MVSQADYSRSDAHQVTRETLRDPSEQGHNIDGSLYLRKCECEGSYHIAFILSLVGLMVIG